MLLKGEFGFVELLIFDRQYSDSIDKDDLNWLDGEIKVEVSGFKAHYKSNLYLVDLIEFCKQLSDLNNQLSQKAKFIAIEDDLILELTVDERGNVLCEGIAFHEGNSLKFKFETDLFTVAKCSRDLSCVLN